MNPPATILVTGATGYIGGRLAPRLLEEGRRVHVLARSAARVRSRSIPVKARPRWENPSGSCRFCVVERVPF